VIASTITFAALRVLARPAQRLGAAAIEANRALAEQMVNTLQGMRTIRAFGQESRREQMFGKASRHARRTFILLDWIYCVIAPVSEMAYLVLLTAIVWLATALEIGLAATVSAVALLYRLQPYMREFEGNRLKLASVDASLGVVRSAVKPSGKTYPVPGSRIFSGLTKEIRFERVSLKYPGSNEHSLKDVSFIIPRGGTTAIIGASGAGKTSIVSLLLRLYAPSDGLILVDGGPLDELERASWLARIAVAGQDVELIDDTILENIRLARHDATQSEIEQAAQLTGIHQLITSLPDGLATWIGDQGLNLSGGQRQRLGLARALIRRPDLLILDEATNALDKHLEDQIWVNLTRFMEGGTIVVITHRMEAILNADYIVYLDDGRVAKEGTAQAIVGEKRGLMTGALTRGSSEGQ
jgi:ABC-type multidrug transport system fused ATPase/permease subunit